MYTVLLFRRKKYQHLEKYLEKFRSGKIARERKFTLKQKSFGKFTHPLKYVSKTFDKKLESAEESWRNILGGKVILIYDLIYRLFQINNVKAIRKNNKCKNSAFGRPICIIVKAVSNFFMISNESYLIRLYIFTIKLFQRSVAAMYLFTKTFRAHICRKTMSL